MTAKKQQKTVEPAQTPAPPPRSEVAPPASVPETAKPQAMAATSMTPLSGYAMVAQEDGSLPWIRFNKLGHWTGPDDVNLDKLIVVARMGILTWIHTRWWEGKPTVIASGLVADMAKGNLPPLIDHYDEMKDQKFWERDPTTGTPKPPIIFGYRLLLEDLRGDCTYVWNASNNGAKKAVGDLCFAFDRYIAGGGRGLPIVQLMAGGYNHPIKSYGFIPTPKLEFTPQKWTLPLPLSASGEEPDPGDLYDRPMDDDIPEQIK
jgi:hypothetical protein